MTDARITRRTALKFGSIVGLGAMAGGMVAIAEPSLDLTSKAGRLSAFMRMRGAIDNGLVIGFLSGKYYGVVDDALTPLYGLVSATFTRYRRSSGLGYEGVDCEQAYYTDLETGQVLDDWRNPYTDEVVKVPAFRSEPKPFKVDENLVFSSAVALPGAHFEQSGLPPVTIGNDVWFTERVVASGRPPGATETFHYSELTTMHARRSELAAGGAKRVPCDTHFTATVSWAPWQKMGNRPGHLLGNGDGGYGGAMSDLPQVWREATLRSRPELVRDPIAVLDPAWKTLGG
jgi:hypothetical protein